ncbi:hypothetical protein JG677_02950 [Campylobacter sp. TTU-622]|uniref:hypothetical protein n=1 Tax=Campylobacter sp. TTU-622 TaxID=2800583 RepID=UPI0019078E0D|nr:hypothetical protein [Campylobacter sp. TTU-622]MBK1973011.1 hypothetical protein [Campylobacter sp. TTU-622]
MKDYYVSEGVKALFSIYFKDQTEENFLKALNEFGKENQLNSQEIKDEALREIKEEISKLVTIDLLNAKIGTIEAKIDRAETLLNTRTDKLEVKIKTYVIFIAVLMFILQPTVFNFIKSIFK